MAIRRIGQIFVDLGFINDEQLELLLGEQEQHPGQLLGRIAQEMGLVTSEQVAQALGEQMGMQVISFGDVTIPPDVVSRVPEPMAQLYQVVPVHFDQESKTLTVATADPQNLSVQDELRSFLGYEIRMVVATESDLQRALERHFAAARETVESVVNELAQDADLKAVADRISTSGPIDLTDVEQLADSVPVRKLLNMILLLAIKDHASDIHFEPFEDEFRIRIKSDGMLYEMVPPPRHLAFAVTTRIKVMADLNIAERRMPQDGRIELTVGGHPIDLRVAVLPTMFGESVVLRLLDRSVVELDLAKIGLGQKMLADFREVMKKPNGIVLVTGPTGCGKTTTLYAALSELNEITDKVITTEDPVEYDLDGIVQIPINSEIGVTFAACLRAILRQDPDRILVGEIRDLETAEIAVQASLTGHLVFSTLHTNDAPGTITRLRNMGVPSFLLTATVEAIISQRLVRRICKQCREQIRPTSEMLAQLDLTADDVGDKRFYRGKGCDACNNTGYKGRIGIFELMVLNEELRALILNNGTTDELRRAARENGLVSLRAAGLDFIYEGTTTAEEVIRETIIEA